MLKTQASVSCLTKPFDTTKNGTNVAQTKASVKILKKPPTQQSWYKHGPSTSKCIVFDQVSDTMRLLTTNKCAMPMSNQVSATCDGTQMVQAHLFTSK